MFDGLQSKLGDIFDGLKKRGALKEAYVDAALRDIRIALVEADVALPVVKEFIEGVRGVMHTGTERVLAGLAAAGQRR